LSQNLTGVAAVISYQDYRTEDGKTDWRAYEAARVQAGEVCYRCRDFIIDIYALSPGYQRTCQACSSMIRDAGAVDHERCFRCPMCRHSWTPDVCDMDRLGSDSEVHTWCPECDHKFDVGVRVTFTFTNPPLIPRPEPEDEPEDEVLEEAEEAEES
jgi:hypothetical protein